MNLTYPIELKFPNSKSKLPAMREDPITHPRDLFVQDPARFRYSLA